MGNKICTKCNIPKDLSEYSKDSSKINGLRSACKPCVSIQYEKYLKTKNGLISRICSNQKGNSKTRGHNPPSYTKQELKDWLFNQELFHVLYEKWVESGYQKDLKPSVDRKDDYKGYSFGNIQLVTWMENKGKQNEDIFLARSTSGECCKSVLQYDKQMNFISEYHSSYHASRELKITQSNISACCADNRKFAGGFIWKLKSA